MPGYPAIDCPEECLFEVRRLTGKNAVRTLARNPANSPFSRVNHTASDRAREKKNEEERRGEEEEGETTVGLVCREEHSNYNATHATVDRAGTQNANDNVERERERKREERRDTSQKNFIHRKGVVEMLKSRRNQTRPAACVHTMLVGW